MTQALPPPEKKRRGNKPGPRTLVNRAAIENAAATGKLPHEILLEIARGTPLVQPRLKWDEARQAFVNDTPVVLHPDLQMRMAAARDSAPYFAPKLSALEMLQSLSDDELNELITVAAAEAGVGIGAAGASPASQGAADSGRRGAGPAGESDSDFAADA